MVTLTDRNNKSWQAHFSCTRPAYDRLVLDGAIDDHHATLPLQRVDEKKFLLATRGFPWIQDCPFNR